MTWIVSAISVTLAFKFLAGIAILCVLRAALWILNMLVLAPPFDPLRKLPGPEGSYWEKHFMQLMDPNVSPDTHDKWVREYGTTWRFQGFGAFDYRLMTFDFRALSYILNSPIYEKPWQTRKLLSRLLGRGVFAMEGQEHSWQRKIMGPAFNSQSVKSLSPIFLQKAEEVRDCWDKMIGPSTVIDKSAHPYPTPPSTPIPGAPPRLELTDKTPVVEPTTVIDVSSWTSRAAFDVIGLAGFDYAFNSIQDETEEVCRAYRKMFNAAEKAPGLKSLIQLWFPFIETLFPDESSRTVAESQKIIKSAGEKLIRSKQDIIPAGKTRSKDIQEKDLLSLLLKANMSEDPSKRLSDAEVLDQLTTFLFSGSDTTALAMSWCIHLLSLNSGVQTRLRQELLEASKSHPSSALDVNVIDALPLLDAVVRETLRISPPAHSSIRVATKDDIIPLSEPMVLRDGTVTREIKIRKGSYIHIPIEGLNTSKDLWGDDAHEFNPDRWISGSVPSRHPGLVNLMSFSFGAHSCPGYKFSILETKVFIATLLPQFFFKPAENIRKFNSIVTRPYVQNKFELGMKLPVKVSRYSD